MITNFNSFVQIFILLFICKLGIVRCVKQENGYCFKEEDCKQNEGENFDFHGNDMAS